MITCVPSPWESKTTFAVSGRLTTGHHVVAWMSRAQLVPTRNVLRLSLRVRSHLQLPSLALPTCSGRQTEWLGTLITVWLSQCRPRWRNLPMAIAWSCQVFTHLNKTTIDWNNGGEFFLLCFFVLFFCCWNWPYMVDLKFISLSGESWSYSHMTHTPHMLYSQGFIWWCGACLLLIRLR